MKNVSLLVEMGLDDLNNRQRKKKIEEIATLVAARLTHGWAFTNQTREQHDVEVKEIKEEVYRRLK